MRKTILRRVANRHNLYLGGDRELVMFSGLLALTLIVVGQTKVTAVIGSLLWLFCLCSLRLMAKADPKLRQVYWRHFFNYRPYYAARASVYAGTRRLFRDRRTAK